eukprot:m.113161 g.113161  ORF g.113161 m.113161 type:complete len:988 (+) comp12798_c0_seq2:95-3058(+)
MHVIGTVLSGRAYTSLLPGVIRSARPLSKQAWYSPLDDFAPRHIGPSSQEQQEMANVCEFEHVHSCGVSCIPSSIHLKDLPEFPKPLSETEMLSYLGELGKQNKRFRSYIGLGYSNTITPSPIKLNILQNPGWYTPYTPYQAEVAQGRMESLLNFQTMVEDLTGFAVANASLLDEATAGAEAMAMCASSYKRKRGERVTFFVDELTHPQVIALIRSRARYIDVDVIVTKRENFDFTMKNVCGCVVQYPDTEGSLVDMKDTISAAKEAGAMVAMGTDLLALTLITPPAELGADIAYGNSQRFGVPLGYGGPHAAFFACDSAYLRRLPGRLIGVTKDAQGNHAYRLSLQTRENQIKRENATSNICTAQALLANVAAMYAVYHGPEGLKKIATRVHNLTSALAQEITKQGHTVKNNFFFDTIKISPNGISQDELKDRSVAIGMNFRYFDDGDVGISLDETVKIEDVYDIITVFGGSMMRSEFFEAMDSAEPKNNLSPFTRTSSYLTHPIFNKIKSETHLMRYCKSLENKDISLTHSMIPLGSCTMKLNSASSMEVLTNPDFASIHPFVPDDQALGYQILCNELMSDLCAISGYDGVSLQPNSGAQGELAGMFAIRAYHDSRGDHHRKMCLIPGSAHGTNPASAVMAGMKVVKVNNLPTGYVDIEHLKTQCEKHKDKLAAIMITYPSTYGVFEENVTEICDLVHSYGAQVYLDGANMNAQMMLARPGDYGADVSHFNLHKTFSIPHGGGGPGMGPIGVKEHLIPFLPGFVFDSNSDEMTQISSAKYGSALILPISWAFIRMLGAEGLRKSSQVAVLNANYMASKLKHHFNIAYTRHNGTVAHEFILDVKPFKKHGIECMDIAKRLQDYGYHSPTVSWPVHDSLMIEPTESESKEEIDRFISVLISIKNEVEEVAEGLYPKDNNVIVNAPHTALVSLSEEWPYPYSREKAAFPAPWMRHHSKVWPGCGRVDDVYGDRNIVCSCPPMDSYEDL